MTNLSAAIPVPEIGGLSGVGGPPVESWKAPSPGFEIQNTLVPTIVYTGPRLEAFGQSIPKEDMGGDLADLVIDGRDVTAYVADVSGHGMRAGVLMGMIKTAVRYGLLLGRPMAKLLDDVNRVLPSVKAPNMFATLAALRFDASNEVEYISAGHVPLLHYQRRSGAVVRYATSQFPLGMFAGAGYVPQRIRYQPGDIFVLVTDGVVELGEEPDAAFGLERLSEIIGGLGELPLSEIAEAINREVKRHGPPQDDRTVLLIRAVVGYDAADPDVPPDGQLNDGNDAPESLEARWRKLLDELTAELAGDP
jgi:serine phosphatase RsbU (regulator of sigma subunit)